MQGGSGVSLLFGCDLLSGLSGSLSLESGSRVVLGKFSDDAELSGLRLQYEVVCLGFALDSAISFVAHCCSVSSLLPIKDGLQQYGEGGYGRLAQVS